MAKGVLTILSLCAALAAAQVDLDAPALHDDIINEVNSARTTWLAGKNEKFHDATLRDVKKLLGTRMDNEAIAYHNSLPVARPLLGVRNVPDSFDARTEWANCSSVIGDIRDQSDCGSCWAMATSEAFSDRLCIKSKGQFTTPLSGQDTASCCTGLACFGSSGCNGGMPGEAWSYFANTGIVTGGGYKTIGQGTSCWPYQLPMCAHHVESQKYPDCSTISASLPACPSPGQCSESGYSTSWAQDLHKAQSAYSVQASVQAIQTEIMTYGPVSAAFSVYSDFPTYTKGVYKHTSGSYLGGHAVKILGWGVENGTPYWLVANSWNESWGDNGYFKILRGSDECGIESQITAGHA